MIAAVLVGQLVGVAGWTQSIVAVIAFMASVLAHELGHATVARQYGVGTEDIRLWALGGVARLDRESPTPRAEGWIAAAGPLVSLAIGLVCVWAGAAIFDPVRATWGTLLVYLGVLNLLLAIFNLLPGSPLDGGRILRAVLWAAHGDRFRATRQAARSGMVIAFMLGGVGVAILLSGGGGFFILLTALFLWSNARIELYSADVSEALDGVTVGDLTWYGVAEAGPDMDADSLLWQRKRLGAAGGVSVTDQTGAPVGLVLEDELWAIPAEQRPWVMLTQLLIPFDHTIRARATDQLSSALRRVQRRQPLITVWDDERLVGMVPPKRLDERLRQATEIAAR